MKEPALAEFHLRRISRETLARLVQQFKDIQTKHREADLCCEDSGRPDPVTFNNYLRAVLALGASRLGYEELLGYMHANSIGPGRPRGSAR